MNVIVWTPESILFWGVVAVLIVGVGAAFAYAACCDFIRWIKGKLK
jgi:hypothetical protein